MDEVLLKDQLQDRRGLMQLLVWRIAITIFNRLTEKERRGRKQRAKAKGGREELVKGGEVSRKCAKKPLNGQAWSLKVLSGLLVRILSVVTSSG